MAFHDVDPSDLDPETGQPYGNYSSPSLDTSFHDSEMNVDDDLCTHCGHELDEDGDCLACIADGTA